MAARRTPTTVDDGTLDAFTGRRAAEIVGITYRQLDYWARTDLVRPSLRDASGSGTRRVYSYRNLLELRAIKTLLDAGIRLESVRQVFTYLRDHLGEDVTAANLVIQGSNSVLVQTDGELVDLLREGQGVLNILPMGSVKSDVDARILELRPALGTVDGTPDAASTPRSAARASGD